MCKYVNSLGRRHFDSNCKERKKSSGKIYCMCLVGHLDLDIGNDLVAAPIFVINCS